MISGTENKREDADDVMFNSFTSFNAKWERNESGNIFGTSLEIFGKLRYLQKSLNNAQKSETFVWSSNNSRTFSVGNLRRSRIGSGYKKVLERKKVARNKKSCPKVALMIFPLTG